MKDTRRKILLNLEEIIAGIFLIITTILVVTNVIFRYFLNSGIYWTEEVATGSFVWTVFIGAAAAYKHGQHLGMDFLVEKVPERFSNIVVLVINVLLTIINGYLFYLSTVYIYHSYRKPTPVLNVSSAYISSALTISFFLMTIRSIMFVYNDLKTIRKVEEV